MLPLQLFPVGMLGLLRRRPDLYTRWGTLGMEAVNYSTHGVEGV